MPRLFLTADGRWGDAEGLCIIDVTNDEIDMLNDSTEEEALETLSQLNPIATFS